MNAFEAQKFDIVAVSHHWMQNIPHPRAAYIGVIDERLDYDIIAAMAQAHSDVQFLMCGPVVKVDPAQLPQAPNLHYPGQQQYADLPRILKGTDVCLMPFAQNEATKFISPTKTLEYMASGRPIVSTPIKDVERFYSDIVYLAATPEAFSKQIDAALNETPQERARKRKREEKLLAEQAWDAIADNMETLMQHEWVRTRQMGVCLCFDLSRRESFLQFYASRVCCIIFWFTSNYNDG